MNFLIGVAVVVAGGYVFLGIANLVRCTKAAFGYKVNESKLFG